MCFHEQSRIKHREPCYTPGVCLSFPLIPGLCVGPLQGSWDRPHIHTALNLAVPAGRVCPLLGEVLLLQTVCTSLPSPDLT